MRRLAAAVALAAVLAGPSAAWAQTSDDGMSPTRCADAAAGDSGLDGGVVGGGAGGGGGGSWGGSSGTTTTTLGQDDDDGICSTLLGRWALGPQPGPYPTENYDLGYDGGGTRQAWKAPLGMLFLNGPFQLGGWFARMGLGTVNWLLDGDLVESLLPAAERIAAAYKTDILGPIDLSSSLLFICAVWAMWLAFAGKAMRGAAELGVSLLITSLAATMWASPGTFLTGALHFTEDFGVSIAGASMGTSGEGESVTAPMAAAVHKAIVERPHEWLNWGRAIPAGDKCRAVYEQAVASGPWGSSSKPRKAMKAAGCIEEMKFNEDISWDRILGALVITLGGAILMVLLVFLALSLLAAELGTLVAIPLAQFAFAAGALPGRGRSLFWRWWASTAVLLCGVMVMTGLLSLVLVGMSAVLEATDDVGVFGQMLLVDVVAGYGLVKRGELVKGSRRAVQGFAQRMASAQPGGAAARRTQVSWNGLGGGVTGAAAGAAGGAVTAARFVDRHQRRSYQRNMQSGRADDAAAGAEFRRAQLDLMDEQAEYSRRQADALDDLNARL